MKFLRRLILLMMLCAFTLSPVAGQSDWIGTSLARMSLEQKLAQMFLVGLFGKSISISEQEFIERWQPGGVFLLEKNAGHPAEITRLTNVLQQTILDAGGSPLWIATDQEGGIIARLKEGFTSWPVWMLLTASGDNDLAFRAGAAIAQELAAVGVNMNLAPVADVNTNPANPIIGRRSFGSEPEKVAPILAAWISGMQSGGVMAVAKHFPGHGDTDSDSHLTLPRLDLDRARLETTELLPFRAAAQAEVGTVMVGHMWLPLFDDDPLAASLSNAVVTKLLREEMGYSGLIMTDALDMDAVDTVYPPEEAAKMAILAGNDLLILGAHYGPEVHIRVIDFLAAAVRSGEIDEARIDASVRRILAAKQAYGLLAWQPLDPEMAVERINREAHEALVTELFLAGVTVVFDRESLIPIAAEETVLLIYPAIRPSVKEACQQIRPDAQSIGVAQYPTAEERNWSIESAKRADAVVIFTLNADSNPDQQRLVQQLPQEKTAAVALWSPYDVLSFPTIGAYMVTYSQIPPAAETACAILFGRIEARGQLSVELNVR